MLMLDWIREKRATSKRTVRYPLLLIVCVRNTDRFWLGTGTQAGDKTEAGAIFNTFGQDRAPDSPLYVGSIKTNIGHTESTAGLAGLVKAVMVLNSAKIPPNLNFSRPNEKIPLNDWKIKVCVPSPHLRISD
jgi:Beta-ketoacyl synthase, C-terminal domain